MSSAHDHVMAARNLCVCVCEFQFLLGVCAIKTGQENSDGVICGSKEDL